VDKYNYLFDSDALWFGPLTNQDFIEFMHAELRRFHELGLFWFRECWNLAYAQMWAFARFRLC